MYVCVDVLIDKRELVYVAFMPTAWRNPNGSQRNQSITLYDRQGKRIILRKLSLSSFTL